MRQLSRALSAAFRPPAPRRPDPHRKSREWAMPVAAEYGIEIERFKPADGGGFNVWPPKKLAQAVGFVDPYEGDHYCHDWDQVESMVRQYADSMGQLKVAP